MSAAALKSAARNSDENFQRYVKNKGRRAARHVELGRKQDVCDVYKEARTCFSAGRRGQNTPVFLTYD